LHSSSTPPVGDVIGLAVRFVDYDGGNENVHALAALSFVPCRSTSWPSFATCCIRILNYDDGGDDDELVETR
jgi:hypothetical protein